MNFKDIIKEELGTETIDNLKKTAEEMDKYLMHIGAKEKMNPDLAKVTAVPTGNLTRLSNKLKTDLEIAKEQEIARKKQAEDAAIAKKKADVVATAITKTKTNTNTVPASSGIGSSLAIDKLNRIPLK